MNTNTGTKLGKGCGVLFFSVFAMFGVFFTAMMGKSMLKDWETRSWVATPAVLLGESSKLEKDRSGDSSREPVPFRYTYEGHSYTQDTVTLKGTMSVNGKKSDSGRRLRNMPAGTQVTCYVNPTKPDEAVLELRSLVYAWFLLLPGVFLLVGVGGVIGVIRAKPAHHQPASERHRGWKSNPNNSTLGLRIFGSIFALIGGVATWFIGVKPMLAARAAEHWQEVPCKIESARVTNHRGSKGGTTYSISVTYRYEVSGQKYVGDRYSFSTGSSSSYDWREQAVRELKRDPHPVCYVNPDDPNDAVLSPTLGNDAWFGLIPLVFVIVGIGIFLGASKMSRARSGPSGIPVPQPQQVVSLAHGGYELKPSASPKAACVGMGCFALFWNGIVWTIFLQADAPFPVRLFLMIFVLVGLGLIGGFGYFILALFNPKPTLIANEHSVALGRSIKLQWRFSGNTARISQLAIILTGKESATYRRGTNTTTDTSLFVHQTLFETRERTNISAGEVTVTIPADSMHSFEASNNKIIWAVKLHGDIAKWPDVNLEFPITVLPL